MPESKAQRRFMGMVHATQTGEIEAPSQAVAKGAKNIPREVAKEIGGSKEKGLPERAKPKWGTTGKISGDIKKKKI